MLGADETLVLGLSVTCGAGLRQGDPWSWAAEGFQAYPPPLEEGVLYSPVCNAILSHCVHAEGGFFPSAMESCKHFTGSSRTERYLFS